MPQLSGPDTFNTHSRLQGPHDVFKLDGRDDVLISSHLHQRTEVSPVKPGIMIVTYYFKVLFSNVVHVQYCLIDSIDITSEITRKKLSYQLDPSIYFLYVCLSSLKACFWQVTIFAFLVVSWYEAVTHYLFLLS